MADRDRRRVVKVEEISSRATREALGAALRIHGVPEEDAVVFVEAQESERRHILVAASIGILEVTHAAIPDHPLQSWALDVHLIPWRSVADLSVASRTIRDQWNGLITTLTVESPTLGLSATAQIGRDSDPDRGLAAFAARSSAEIARSASG